MAARAHTHRLVAWVLVAMPLGPALSGSRPASAQSPSELAGLLTQLQDDSPAVRRKAAEALGRLGPAARDAVPALVLGSVLIHPPELKGFNLCSRTLGDRCHRRQEVWQDPQRRHVLPRGRGVVAAATRPV